MCPVCLPLVPTAHSRPSTSIKLVLKKGSVQCPGSDGRRLHSHSLWTHQQALNQRRPPPLSEEHRHERNRNADMRSSSGVRPRNSSPHVF